MFLIHVFLTHNALFNTKWQCLMWGMSAMSVRILQLNM